MWPSLRFILVAPWVLAATLSTAALRRQNPADLSCELIRDEAYFLAWVNPVSHDGIRVFRGWTALADLPGTATSYLDENIPPCPRVHEVLPCRWPSTNETFRWASLSRRKSDGRVEDVLRRPAPAGSG